MVSHEENYKDMGGGWVGVTSLSQEGNEASIPQLVPLHTPRLDQATVQLCALPAFSSQRWETRISL